VSKELLHTTALLIKQAATSLQDITALRSLLDEIELQHTSSEFAVNEAGKLERKKQTPSFEQLAAKKRWTVADIMAAAKLFTGKLPKGMLPYLNKQ